jgi:two-component system, chemotaxis family, CheB/CheR fusion protein
MAFVLIQHLSPDHKSMLTELIRHHTRMPVFEVEDGMVVKPNCVYVIPPNRDIALLRGTLQLLEPAAPRGMRLPIDFFFRSLADDQHERAVGIVLSGTGSDGSLGVRAIKGAGGMVMAQTPSSTDHDGMPRAAIATGTVDYVLEPGEMAAQLASYVTHIMGLLPREVSSSAPKNEDALKKIFVLLRVQTSHDFSQYKQSTIVRRMAIHQIEHINAYVSYLRNEPEEVEALFRDLLIGVTNFFRDPEAFEALKAQVIPKLFAQKSPGDLVRVWVPACSTGEEAYSIAMLLQERMDDLRQNFKLQIFATDIDAQAIAQARTAIYPASISADVSAERLARFFTHDQVTGSYRIEKRIRDLLTFSEQDIIRHPPFSKLDLISCRNVLIYLDADLQKKLIPLFDYALNAEGFLFLGSSETVGEHGDLFATLDRKWKLYQRCNEGGYAAGRMTLGKFFRRPPQEGSVRAAPKASQENRLSLRELTERTLLQQFTVAGALVDERGAILYVHGRTGRYLEPAPGEAGLNILKMARDGLRRELARAFHRASAHDEAVREAGLRVENEGSFASLNLTVRPVPGDPSIGIGPRLFLIAFEEIPDVQATALEHLPVAGAEGTEADARLASLYQELRDKEMALQRALEEMEASNEELRSSHEEMQSGTEELQSTNEELETSKEELQSLNEELATVNSELQQKVADLSLANNDMNNLLAATGIGTIFVDHKLQIQRFTPAVTQVINLIPTDVGRPVGHILSNLVGYNRLLEDTQLVLDRLIPIEIEVQNRSGAWYLLRIQPYRTLENVIEGAVISFFNITEMEAARARRRESNIRLRHAMEPLRHLVWSCYSNRTCDYAGPQWLDYTGVPEAEHLGLGWLKQVRPKDLDELITEWDEKVKVGSFFELEFSLRRRDGNYRRFQVRVEPQADNEGRPAKWFLVGKDVEDQRRAETAFRESEAKWRMLFESMPLGVIFQDNRGKIIDANPAAERLWGLSVEQMKGLTLAGLPVKSLGEDQLELSPATSPAMQALRTGVTAQNVTLGIQPVGKTEVTWLRVNSIPQFRPGEDVPFQVYSIFDEMEKPAVQKRVMKEGA